MVLQWKICETVFKVGLTTVFFYTVVSPQVRVVINYVKLLHSTQVLSHNSSSTHLDVDMFHEQSIDRVFMSPMMIILLHLR